MTQIDSPNIPDTACCLGCGYLLRGLEQPVCPECGRKFDPDDPTSFAATAKLRLWRRWRWRLVGMFALVILLVVAAPRGYQDGSLKISCSTCQKSVTFRRWQLLPPRWMPRYPGYSWIETPQTQQSAPGGPDCLHNWLVSFSFKGGHVAISASYGFFGRDQTINGQRITLETAESDLKILLHPMIAGVGP